MNFLSEEAKINKQIEDAKAKLAAKAGTNPKEERKKKRKRNKEETEKRRLENKLMRVLTKAGVSWASWISLIEIADDINGHPLPFDTACWVFNEHTKKERIIFSRRIMKELPVPLLIMVLKHEMLHKSMYRGTKNVGNQALLNFALDAAINKILWLSNPKQMVKLGNWLFPEGTKSRHTVQAIMNPASTSKDRKGMDMKVRMIFDDIWWVERLETDSTTGMTVDNGDTCSEHHEKYGRFGNHFVPDPMNLYNKMAALLSKKDKKKIEEIYGFLKDDPKNKTPNHVRGGPKNMRATDKDSIQAEKKFAQDILDAIENQGRKCDRGRYNRGGGYSAFTDMHAFFEQFVYTQKEADTYGIEEFIHRWETEKQIEGIAQDIYNTFKKNATIEPFPHDLTRTGLELVALGVSGPELPFFMNDVAQGDGGKKKVCCYFDCSPSMHEFIPYMLYVTEFLDSCEECEIAGGKFNGRYVFSEKVKGIPEDAWEDFKKGEVRGGFGTSFDSVVTHALKRIENDDVDVIIIFTDGYSYVNDDNVEKFNESGKRCYTIYFSHGNYYYYHSRRRQGDNQGMESDLDRLNGETFTVHCKRER